MHPSCVFSTVLVVGAACGSGGDGGFSDAAVERDGGEADAQPGDGGPVRDRFVFCSARSGNFEIYKREGGADLRLSNDPVHDAWWPRISPDRSRIAFYRSAVADRPETGGWDNNYERAELWIMDADGGGARRLLSLSDQGWSAQGVAIWSPDGENLIMLAREAETGRWGI
jgi:Tol biopolymer transport system component